MDVLVSTLGLKLIHVNKRSYYLNQEEVEVPVLIIVTFINALTSSTLLGVILTSVPEKHLESQVLTTAFSDHYSVFTLLVIF